MRERNFITGLPIQDPGVSDLGPYFCSTTCKSSEFMGVADVIHLSEKFQPFRIEFACAWTQDLANLAAPHALASKPAMKLRRNVR